MSISGNLTVSKFSTLISLCQHFTNKPIRVCVNIVLKKCILPSFLLEANRLLLILNVYIFFFIFIDNKSDESSQPKQPNSKIQENNYFIICVYYVEIRKDFLVD
uniref:Uncharacterized protein n=1 Tax=Cacopsylla melanoneura TaxID=428564 RepID=A0A8D8ZY05_9HEMI